MLTRKRTALALGLLAGRAGCLAHPTGSIHKITIRLAANEGKARLFSYPVTAKSATKLSRRVPSRFTEEDCRGSSIRGLRPLERNVRAASGVGRVSFMRLPAVQLMTFRRHARGRATMSTTAAKGTTAVAPPSGGYPPPVHLNGVFAVYKPKGFSSADAVQKIKVSFIPEKYLSAPKPSEYPHTGSPAGGKCVETLYQVVRKQYYLQNLIT